MLASCLRCVCVCIVWDDDDDNNNDNEAAFRGRGGGSGVGSSGGKSDPVATLLIGPIAFSQGCSLEPSSRKTPPIIGRLLGLALAEAILGASSFLVVRSTVRRALFCVLFRVFLLSRLVALRSENSVPAAHISLGARRVLLLLARAVQRGGKSLERPPSSRGRRPSSGRLTSPSIVHSLIHFFPFIFHFPSYPSPAPRTFTLLPFSSTTITITVAPEPSARAPCCVRSRALSNQAASKRNILVLTDAEP